MERTSPRKRHKAPVRRLLPPSGAIRCDALRKALDAAQMRDTWLIKGRGYFYVLHNGDTLDSIYVNSFNQLSVPQWVERIKDIVKNG